MYINTDSNFMEIGWNTGSYSDIACKYTPVSKNSVVKATPYKFCGDFDAQNSF